MEEHLLKWKLFYENYSFEGQVFKTTSCTSVKQHQKFLFENAPGLAVMLTR